MTETAEIGIIGGTGVYDQENFEDSKEIKVFTPFGETSDLISVGVSNNVTVAFIPRHGRNHTIPPHRVNYRANVWALKQLGVKRIIASTAVGSLREDYGPGTFVIPDQFIDRTNRLRQAATPSFESPLAEPGSFRSYLFPRRASNPGAAFH